MSSIAARSLSVSVLALLAAWSVWLAQDAAGRVLSFALIAGSAFGIVLQRGRFCFLCNLRDFVERRDASGVIAILVALAAGIVLYQAVLGAWVPVPQPDRLPPNAHIGPVGPVLAFAAFTFGLGMALSGSCLSAHLYRLGEGAFGSLAALLGAAAGFLLGFSTWNALYTWTVFDDPPVWLPGVLGYAGATIAGLLALGALAWLVLRNAAPPQHAGLHPASSFETVFVRRWPPVVTGLLVATIGAFAYLRVAPLGVTAELGSLVRTGGLSLDLVPETLVGLDTVRGCVSAVKTALLSPNGVFVIGLVLSSFASALLAGRFDPSWPGPRGLAARFAGGVLMGWGAMTGLGCTVGVLLSGIQAGAVSGWVFLVFCTLGAVLGLAGQRRLARDG
ncbi:YeeE/YedE family protein [Shinella sp.]|uniref:YeeE/YedE family protein n=1 Tax=Shinella sp. TaxID=1870904 RepID=UPI00258AD6E8|nr:YeeE/YedE family protein [Shinella sp.]MCW5708078.1 YeeE/YedE family protein [Shinella sp.]